MMTIETAARFAADVAAQEALEQMFGYYEPLADAPVAAAEDFDDYALAA